MGDFILTFGFFIVLVGFLLNIPIIAALHLLVAKPLLVKYRGSAKGALTVSVLFLVLVIKAYGEKKNVWFCPDCKAKGNMVSLTMMQRTLKYEEAINFLKEKAVGFPGRKIENELKLSYTLEYHKKLEEEGISKETAALLEIGKPKGKGILAGHIAFTVFDDEGKKVAYFGIHPETGKAKSHSSFNPELYLYRWNAVDPEQSVFFTPDMFECVRQVMGGHQAVCNFGLPYLSQTHLKLLATCSTVVFSPGISNETMNQAARNLENPLCFLKDNNNGK